MDLKHTSKWWAPTIRRWRGFHILDYYFTLVIQFYSQIMDRLKPFVSTNVIRLKELLELQIFTKQLKDRCPEFNSVVTEIFITMTDLLGEAERLGNRINFTDDVPIRSKPKIRDITDFIRHFRNGLSHTDSERRNFTTDHNYLHLGIATGKGLYMKYKDEAGKTVALETKYDDDIALLMGRDAIYLKRQIYRVCKELFDFFDPLLE